MSRDVDHPRGTPVPVGDDKSCTPFFAIIKKKGNKRKKGKKTKKAEQNCDPSELTDDQQEQQKQLRVFVKKSTAYVRIQPEDKAVWHCLRLSRDDWSRRLLGDAYCEQEVGRVGESDEQAEDSLQQEHLEFYIQKRLKPTLERFYDAEKGRVAMLSDLVILREGVELWSETKTQMSDDHAVAPFKVGASLWTLPKGQGEIRYKYTGDDEREGGAYMYLYKASGESDSGGSSGSRKSMAGSIAVESSMLPPPKPPPKSIESEDESEHAEREHIDAAHPFQKVRLMLAGYKAVDDKEEEWTRPPVSDNGTLHEKAELGKFTFGGVCMCNKIKQEDPRQHQDDIEELMGVFLGLHPSMNLNEAYYPYKTQIQKKERGKTTRCTTETFVYALPHPRSVFFNAFNGPSPQEKEKGMKDGAVDFELPENGYTLDTTTFSSFWYSQMLVAQGPCKSGEELLLDVYGNFADNDGFSSRDGSGGESDT